MTTIVLALKSNGDLYAVGATEDTEIVLVTEEHPARALRVENIELREIPLEELHATTCDHLSMELQAGRLNLVKLNQALRLEK